MGWTIQEVGEWLANAGMAELKDNFAHNLVDGSVLLSLNESSKLDSLTRREKLDRKKAMSLVRKVNVLANDSYSQGMKFARGIRRIALSVLDEKTCLWKVEIETLKSSPILL
tara:strand:+ start:217 stop:552 length:336 start_codon:yes stop_codon:yes gene_type:complete